MRPIKEIYCFPKPSFCKDKSVAYIDWGHGLTPHHQDSTVPIMAMAWDKLIQLVYIDESNASIEIDGFYYSTDGEITSCHFLAESILLV